MKFGPFICYSYPVGGIAFKLGEGGVIHNITFALGFMTKKSFIGFMKFTDPRVVMPEGDELENLKVKEDVPRTKRRRPI